MEAGRLEGYTFGFVDHIRVLDNGCDPDGIDPQGLKVIQLCFQTSKVTTMITQSSFQVHTIVVVKVSVKETVSHGHIDDRLIPVKYIVTFFDSDIDSGGVNIAVNICDADRYCFLSRSNSIGDGNGHFHQGRLNIHDAQTQFGKINGNLCNFVRTEDIFGEGNADHIVIIAIHSGVVSFGSNGYVSNFLVGQNICGTGFIQPLVESIQNRLTAYDVVVFVFTSCAVLIVTFITFRFCIVSHGAGFTIHNHGNIAVKCR